MTLTTEEIVQLARRAAQITTKCVGSAVRLGVEFEDYVSAAWRKIQKLIDSGRQPPVGADYKRWLVNRGVYAARSYLRLRLVRHANHPEMQIPITPTGRECWDLFVRAPERLSDGICPTPLQLWCRTWYTRVECPWRARLFAVLIHVEQMTHDEVAKMWDGSVGTIRTSVGMMFWRARANLPSKRDWDVGPITMNRLQPGDQVRINAPGNERMHDTLATVIHLADWGAYLEAPAAATGRFRAAWSEMIPIAAAARTVPGAVSGEVCDRCGGSNLIRTGACLLCQDCGQSGGCG